MGRIMKRAARLGVGAVCVALLAGCVERRMTIISDPPGAKVIVNGHDLGAAPVDVPSNLFIYYGNYEISLLRDGYEPLLINQAVPAPHYEWFPLDFISENLLPVHFKDRRVFTYVLPPTIEVPPDELTRRANEQRGRGQMIGAPAIITSMTPASSPPPADETLPLPPTPLNQMTPVAPQP
jgi:hypothetical protein